MTEKTKETKDTTFESIIKQMSEIHKRKAQDYSQNGNSYSNFQRAAELSSWFSDPVDRVFATLIGVKLARIAELSSSGKTPINESVQDSHLDLETYCAIWHSYKIDFVKYEDNLLENVKRILTSSTC